MPRQATYIEIRSSNGSLLFTVTIFDKEIAADGASGTTTDKLASHDAPRNGKPEAPARPQSGGKEQQPHDGKGRGDEPLMTDAQKKYIFRLLAEQDIEGEQAHEHVKKTLQVESLKEVTKLEASQFIEQLLGQGKGG